MSALTNPMPTLDPRAYDPGRAESLALAFASGEPGTSLPELHRAFPETYPAPLIVRRWRSVFPAFDALMREAESARAHALMDATLPIADDSTRGAAHAKNAIAARWRLAEALAPESFGSRGAKSPGDDGEGLGRMHVLSDAQLYRIARGADPRALLENDPAPPTSPPLDSDDGFNGGREARPLPHAFALPDLPALEREPAESDPA